MWVCRALLRTSGSSTKQHHGTPQLHSTSADTLSWGGCTPCIRCQTRTQASCGTLCHLIRVVHLKKIAGIRCHITVSHWQHEPGHVGMLDLSLKGHHASTSNASFEQTVCGTVKVDSVVMDLSLGRFSCAFLPVVGGAETTPEARLCAGAGMARAAAGCPDMWNHGVDRYCDRAPVLDCKTCSYLVPPLLMVCTYRKS